MNPQDPLAQLRDIHLPEAVSWWPPAPGWWLLLTVILACLLYLAIVMRRRYRARAYKRQSLTLLYSHHAYWETNRDAQLYLQQLNEVLKRVALTCFPQQDVASLSGEDWVAFLDSKLPAGEAYRFKDSQLATSLYRPQVAIDEAALEALHKLAGAWIKAQVLPRV